MEYTKEHQIDEKVYNICEPCWGNIMKGLKDKGESATNCFNWEHKKFEHEKRWEAIR